MDQATDLRRLARRDATQLRVQPHVRPRLIAVASGKGGVGTTTVAVNLAVALAQSGHATILVDADLNGADVARVCQLNDAYSLAHVLAGARSVHEVLCRGPGGTLVIPGVWAPDRLAECSPQAQERLLSSLWSLGEHARFIVLDIGSGLNRVVRRFWHAADRVLLVTTPDDAAIMNTYAAVKVLSDGDQQLPISLLTNLAASSDDMDVHARLSQACRRFLGIELARAGTLPASQHVRAAEAARLPLVLHAPGAEITRQVEQLAQSMIPVLEGETNGTKPWQRELAEANTSQSNAKCESSRATQLV